MVVLPVRFNMLHRGHEAYIRAVLRSKPSAVYIFLGRCNAFRIDTDPFDDVERRCMIEAFCASLDVDERRRIHIFPIFNRQPGAIKWTKETVDEWYGHCARLVKTRGLAHWDVVISGNPYTNGYEGDIEFISPYDLVTDTDQVFTTSGQPVNATWVRSLMYRADSSWRDFVSSATARIVDDCLRRFPLEAGPLDGRSHRVRVNQEIGTLGHCDIECSVEDGEFKDEVAARAVAQWAADRGGRVLVHPPSCETPYIRRIGTDHGGESWDAAIVLDEVVSGSAESLHYRFSVSEVLN